MAAREAWGKYVTLKAKEHVRILGIVIGSVVFAAALLNVVTIFERRWAQKRNSNVQTREVPAVIRTKRFLAAIVRKQVSYRTVTLFGTSISFPELAIITLYLITQYTLCFTEAPRAPPSPPVPGSTTIAKRNFGWTSRAGWLFVAGLPWVTLLSMKHNLLAWVTGIGYDRLQVLHRGIALVTLSMAIIHSASKLWLNPSVSIQWRAQGLFAFVAVLLTVLISLAPVRRLSYQIFVHCHVVLLVLMYVGIWNHLKGIKNSGQKDRPYVIAALSFWVLDRVLRLANVIWLNGLYRLKGRPGDSRAVITVHSPDLLKLEVSKPNMPRWEAGSHVYLISPPAWGISPFLEGHPFTVASVSETSSSPVKLFRESEKDADNHVDSDITGRRLDFFIRPRSGFTKRLLQKAKKQQDINLLVYGPFSPPTSFVGDYSSIVLIGAGSGVSWTLPLLLDSCQRSQRIYGLKRIVWVWVVRHLRDLAIVRPQVLQALQLAASHVAVEISIHITRDTVQGVELPAEWLQASVTGGDKDESGLSLRQGRPDLASTVRNVVDSSEGRVWIGVSGPARISLEVKSTARRLIKPANILRGDDDGDITVHTEVFGW